MNLIRQILTSRAVVTSAPPPSNDPISPDRLLRIGRRVTIYGFGGLMAWLLFANISGAVVASGFVIVETDVKKVQHQTGGVVGSILVRNGQRIAAGDVLIRLDETIPRTNLAQIVAQLTSATARRARLEAERDGRDSITFPAGFVESSPEAALVAQSERRLLQEDRNTRRQQAGQLEERVGQLSREIEGLTSQITASRQQATFIDQELAGVQALYDRKLVPLTRLAALQREAARLRGDAGALEAAVAKTRGQIAELNLQLLSLEQKTRADAVKELIETENQIAQLTERRAAATDILSRIEIRAPQSGYVHELLVRNVGAVITPGETVMQVVPDKDRLIFEVRVGPQDIHQVHLGQRAMIRFPALNRQTTPELSGMVRFVSPDVTREPQTGLMYFVIRAEATEEEVGKLGDVALVPGMPVEAFIETGSRTAISFLTKPLRDSLSRAFREG